MFRHNLRAFSLRVVGVSGAEQTAITGTSFEEHAVAAGIGRAVGHAMLNRVDIDSAAKGLMQAFFSRPLHNFIHDKIRRFGMLAMKQGGGDPDFVGDFEFDIAGGLGHSRYLGFSYHYTK